MALTFNSGIFDVNTHMSVTEHMIQDNCILIAGRDVPEAHRRAQEGGRAGRPRHGSRNAVRRCSPTTRRSATRCSAKKIVISEVDKAAFTEAVKDIVKEFPAGAKWAERAKAIN